MRKIIGFILLCLVFTGCSAMDGGDIGAQREAEPLQTDENLPQKTTLESVAEFFEESGFTVSEWQKAERNSLRGERYVTYLGAGEDTPFQLTVYRYEDAVAAQADALCILDDGFGLTIESTEEWEEGVVVCVDWVAPPHFYLYQNLILQYIGDEIQIIGALEELCGGQIAGGNSLPGVFSYEQAIFAHREGDPGVKYDGFVNSSALAIGNQWEAMDRAESECTVAYDTVAAFYDGETDMWMVHFSMANTLGEDQSVFLDSSGITRLIVWGE